MVCWITTKTLVELQRLKKCFGRLSLHAVNGVENCVFCGKQFLAFKFFLTDCFLVTSTCLVLERCNKSNLQVQFALGEKMNGQLVSTKEYILVIERTVPRCVFQKCVSPIGLTQPALSTKHRVHHSNT